MHYSGNVIGCIMSGIKVMGVGWGGGALIRRETQKKRFLNRVYNAFSLQSLAHAIQPEAIPAIHRWLKHQNGTGKLHSRFFSIF